MSSQPVLLRGPGCQPVALGTLVAPPPAAWAPHLHALPASCPVPPSCSPTPHCPVAAEHVPIFDTRTMDFKPVASSRVAAQHERAPAAAHAPAHCLLPPTCYHLVNASSAVGCCCGCKQHPCLPPALSVFSASQLLAPLLLGTQIAPMHVGCTLFFYCPETEWAIAHILALPRFQVPGHIKRPLS